MDSQHTARSGTDAGTRLVYVEINYAADGMPSATPDVCEVPPGATVVWRGPSGVETAFELRFKRASPDPADPKGVFASRPSVNRQEATLRMGGPPGRYEYGICANGRERDPAIIIR